MFWAQGASPQVASLILNTESAIGTQQITASIVGETMVAFTGYGWPELTAGDESDRATVVAAPGEADIVAIAPGETPQPGEVDLTGAERVPATITVTVDCLRHEG